MSDVEHNRLWDRTADQEKRLRDVENLLHALDARGTALSSERIHTLTRDVENLRQDHDDLASDVAARFETARRDKVSTSRSFLLVGASAALGLGVDLNRWLISAALKHPIP
jgi:outer membrane murein-binding lipoprotein Lpp